MQCQFLFSRSRLKPFLHNKIMHTNFPCKTHLKLLKQNFLNYSSFSSLHVHFNNFLLRLHLQFNRYPLSFTDLLPSAHEVNLTIFVQQSPLCLFLLRLLIFIFGEVIEKFWDDIIFLPFAIFIDFHLSCLIFVMQSECNMDFLSLSHAHTSDIERGKRKKKQLSSALWAIVQFHAI